MSSPPSGCHLSACPTVPEKPAHRPTKQSRPNAIRAEHSEQETVRISDQYSSRIATPIERPHRFVPCCYWYRNDSHASNVCPDSFLLSATTPNLTSHLFDSCVIFMVQRTIKLTSPMPHILPRTRPDKPAMAPRNLSINCNASYKLRRARATVGLPDSAGINVPAHASQSIIKEVPHSLQMKIPNH